MHRRFLLSRLLLSDWIFLAPEDGGGGGPPAGGSDAPAGGDGGGGGGGGGSPPAAAQPYRPEGLPDHLFGASDKDTIDGLFKAFDGYRKGEATRTEKFGTLPKDATGYTLTVPEEAKAYVGDLAKDPVYLQFQKHAFDAGITDKQFNTIVGGYMKDVIVGGELEPPWDPDREREALIPAAQMPDLTERAREVERRSRDAIAWVQQLKSRGLDEGSAAFLESGLDTAAGIKAVEWMRAQLRETTPLLGGQGAGGMSASDLRARNADPRNDPSSIKYDQAFAAETDALYRRTYGDGPRS